MQSKDTISLSAIGKLDLENISIGTASKTKYPMNDLKKPPVAFSWRHSATMKIRHRLPHVVLYFDNKLRQLGEAGGNQFSYSFKVILVQPVWYVDMKARVNCCYCSYLIINTY